MSNDRQHDSQEKPTPNQGPSIIDMVCEDLQKRKAFGIKKYGVHLQPFNGRDALKDLYEELLDSANYIRQKIEEERIIKNGLPAEEVTSTLRKEDRTVATSDSEELTLASYTQATNETALYPEHGTGSMLAIVYSVLGLVGEAGEVAGKLKKIIRDGSSQDKWDGLADELGDVSWYWSRIAIELKKGPYEILKGNLDKLRSRKTRGTIQGSGDKR